MVSFVHYTTLNLIPQTWRVHIFSIISKINYDFLTKPVSIQILFSSSKCFSPNIRIFFSMGIFNIHRYIQIMSNETSFPIKMSKEHLKNSLSSPLCKQLSLSFLFSTFCYSFKHSIILEKNFEYLWRCEKLNTNQKTLDQLEKIIYRISSLFFIQFFLPMFANW